MTFIIFLRANKALLCTKSHAVALKKTEKKADRNILAITDFTKSSTHAILFAANLFKNSILKFKLVNVFDNPNDKASLLISIEDILTKDSEAGLNKQSAEITSALETMKFHISTYSTTGRLKKAIGTIAQADDVDLIVAGAPSDKYPCKNLNNIPLLFMGQSRYPILIVPENCFHNVIKNILILNLGGTLAKYKFEKGFEHIVNHDHISKREIHINEKKMDKATTTSIQSILNQKKTDLIIIIPAPGDKIDRSLLDYQIHDLCPSIAALLNC